MVGAGPRPDDLRQTVFLEDLCLSGLFFEGSRLGYGYEGSSGCRDFCDRASAAGPDDHICRVKQWPGVWYQSVDPGAVGPR